MYYETVPSMSESLHGMIWSTRFFFMLAGRFPVLMFSFIMRTLVSFWWEKTRTDGNDEKVHIEKYNANKAGESFLKTDDAGTFPYL